MNARILPLAAVLVLAALHVRAALPGPITLAESGLGLAIPDNDPAGLARTLTLADTNPWGEGYSVVVSLWISPVGAGAFTGDYYAYLAHDSGAAGESRLAVLLNRTGRTAATPAGYSDAGFDITLRDSAPDDVHSYRIAATGSAITPLPPDGIVTGAWQPDARSASPYTVLDSSPRDAFLAPLGLIDPNGTWTLFAADLAAGGEGALESWSVTLTPIPEPSTIGVLALSTLVVAATRLARIPRRPIRSGP